MRKQECTREVRSNMGWFSVLVRELIHAVVGRIRIRDDSLPQDHIENGAPQAEVLAQYHAAEYASERNSVDVWKTLQYALIPLIFVAWSLLVQIREALNPVVFC